MWNWKNIRKKNLSFREYIPTLYYTLSDVNTGEVIEHKNVFNIIGDEKVYSVGLSDNIPFGKYVFTVWGGLSDDSPLKDDPQKAILHIGNRESDDLYLADDTLVYDAENYLYTVDMERVKGKLIVHLVNLPRSANHSDNTIDSLFKRVDRHFNYTESTSVYKRFDRQDVQETVIKTVLAPSGKDRYSLLKLNFYATDKYDLSTFSPKGMNIILKRNELTVLRYVYNGNGEFLIYMLVNDNWEQQHGLVIN
ncbi:hypothetical protein [Parabacteroides sp. AM58-2XD]|uniref:hypothetical protein n=1 Tax=Parabacteroides sp. AM58-2XD TaxID=2292362 RepID=UPI0018F4CAD7|nr:hypothetical protein [Parabacteroides sp. AM58-2XD]